MSASASVNSVGKYRMIYTEVLPVTAVIVVKTNLQKYSSVKCSDGLHYAGDSLVFSAERSINSKGFSQHFHGFFTISTSADVTLQISLKPFQSIQTFSHISTVLKGFSTIFTDFS